MSKITSTLWNLVLKEPESLTYSKNCHLTEYLYRGDVTSARLFVRMSGKREELGLVGYWDVVAWDEFEQQKGRAVDAVLIDTMQNYLANKSFNRGKGTHEASASMVLLEIPNILFPSC